MVPSRQRIVTGDGRRETFMESECDGATTTAYDHVERAEREAKATSVDNWTRETTLNPAQEFVHLCLQVSVNRR